MVSEFIDLLTKGYKFTLEDKLWLGLIISSGIPMVQFLAEHLAYSRFPHSSYTKEIELAKRDAGFKMEERESISLQLQHFVRYQFTTFPFFKSVYRTLID